MDRHLRPSRAEHPDGSPPSEAWLFAQAIQETPLRRIARPETVARANREKLERLSQFSTSHLEELRRIEAAEAEAQRDREVLEWAAGVSTRAEEQLRVLQRDEAENREGWRRTDQFCETYCPSLSEWEEDKHPRQPKGTPQGGQFAPTAGGGFLGDVIRRNQVVGELSGVVSPDMVRSSRLAAKLQTAGRLPAGVAAAAAAGLVTGSKAIVNGSATAVKNAATLGLSSSQLELIGVTKEDRQRGYDTSVSIATASGQVLIAVGTSGLAAALSKGGTVARTASGSLIAFDAAGNAVGTIQGAFDATQNGISLENGLQIAGGSLGLSANIKAARDLSQAASAAKLKEVEAYITKCPRTPTPTKPRYSQYEVAHTGPYNYKISGGGKDFKIDGYRGTTILDSKCVGDVKSSPFVPGSTCPAGLRTKILKDEREKLEKLRSIIQSGETPFKSIEIITNTPESKALYEGLLKEVGIPGTVRLAI